MRVESWEKSTGRGAEQFTAILVGREWKRISSLPNTIYLGRGQGYVGYAVEVADGVISAAFDRSNQGSETVTASNGLSWETFAAAHQWAAGRTA